MMNAKDMVSKLQGQGVAGLACGKVIDGQCEWGSGEDDRCGDECRVFVVLGTLQGAAIPIALCKAHAHALEDEFERRSKSLG